MVTSRALIALFAAFALVACSSGGGGSPTSGASSGGGTTGGSGGGTTGTGGTDCSLRARQNWVKAQMDEWYLFPETLPATLDPAPYSTVQDYVDALTATARSQGKDRYFTYVDSIAEETAFFASGQTAAFGIRLQTQTAARRLFVIDSYVGSPASGVLGRGIEILAIGPNTESLTSVSSLIAQGGDALNAAFGPATVGVTRSFLIRDGVLQRNATLTKAQFNIPPVPLRQILDDRGQRIGYVNLRTFIDTADPALRDAFSSFRSQGINQFIIDLRYNGGGLVDIAELLGDLLGDNRLTGDVFSTTNYRASKAQFDETRRFRSQPQSVAPVKIAFITTDASASASELVINSMEPWLRGNVILVGANSYGKPVGQIARDRTACDDRLRVVAFATRNADGRGDYYDGLASKVARTCAARDDLDYYMGDPAEASTRAALDALAGQSCTAIGAVSTGQSLPGGRRELLVPARPGVVQREVPGSY